ncbi:MAG: hypothetical protein ACK5QC_16570 [Bacteroidota bacterium]|jgi:hypothetical protein|nr:hypothetical protein [Bacteroidota bacterium]MCA6443582.1 hypothetical protein [Bacteroidota bacterium]
MTKVWTYLIDKDLNEQELSKLKAEGVAFVNQWTAHENPLAASFEIYKNKIIVVKVDESQHGASGCSVDKLLRFIKQSENEFQINLLNRLLVAVETNDGIKAIPSSSIKDKIVSREMTGETLVYDTAVANGEAFETWLKPLKTTWLNKYL